MTTLSTGPDRRIHRLKITVDQPRDAEDVGIAVAGIAAPHWRRDSDVAAYAVVAHSDWSMLQCITMQPTEVAPLVCTAGPGWILWMPC